MEILRKISINPGAVVSGEDFFNRNKEFESFKKRLNTTKHIVISQIRRTGKTSFLKEFIVRNPQLPTIYVIVQGCQNESMFYKEIYQQIIQPSKSQKLISFLKSSWNTIAEMFPENKYVKFGKISEISIEQIKMNLENILSKKEFILFIDEFPDFILTLKKNRTVESFLGKFRDFRNKCKKLKIVLTGSINLFRTVSKLGLSDKLNEYKTFKFPLFSPENSLLLFRCLLYSEDFVLDKKSREYVFPYIKDGMPYFIQLLADEIRQAEPEKKELDADILDKALNRIFDSEEFGLEEFHNHLKKYLQEENLEKPAKIILSHLSHDKLDFDTLYSYVDNYITKERLDELLNRLEDEAYIKREGNEYAFLSKLMAGWWKQNKHFERN